MAKNTIESINNDNMDLGKRVESFGETIKTDLEKMSKWAQENPVKATAAGIFTLLALRSKTIRGLVGSTAVAFLTTKVKEKVEHTLH